MVEERTVERPPPRPADGGHADRWELAGEADPDAKPRIGATAGPAPAAGPVTGVDHDLAPCRCRPRATGAYDRGLRLHAGRLDDLDPDASSNEHVPGPSRASGAWRKGTRQRTSRPTGCSPTPTWDPPTSSATARAATQLNQSPRFAYTLHPRLRRPLAPAWCRPRTQSRDGSRCARRPCCIWVGPGGRGRWGRGARDPWLGQGRDRGTRGLRPGRDRVGR